MKEGEFMHKCCKIRIYPNQTQIGIIQRNLNGCRFVYNLYLEYNHRIYDTEGLFLSGYDFSKILTQLKKNDEKYFWLKEISSKAMKDAIMTAEKAYKRFFAKIGGYPKFRSKKRNPIHSFFFVKDNIKFYCNRKDKKNKIQLPILGEVRITEKDYLPDKSLVTSGRVIYVNNKYYVVFIYSIEPEIYVPHSPGIGLDLGIKSYATCYREDSKCWSYQSYLKYKRYIELEEKITDIQRIISKKSEFNYGRLLNEYFDNHHNEPNETQKNIMKGESYNTSKIRKLRKKLSILYEKRVNYAKDHILKMIHGLIQTCPEYIAIENLEISNMLENDSNHKLHDLIAKSKWYFFQERLLNKARESSVEIRYPKKKYFASSKLCSNCGHKLKSLSLANRTYHCPECGLEIDRDLNAAINLCFMKKYEIA